jgi:hypothetical protein
VPIRLTRARTGASRRERLNRPYHTGTFAARPRPRLGRRARIHPPRLPPGATARVASTQARYVARAGSARVNPPRWGDRPTSASSKPVRRDARACLHVVRQTMITYLRAQRPDQLLIRSRSGSTSGLVRRNSVRAPSRAMNTLCCPPERSIGAEAVRTSSQAPPKRPGRSRDTPPAGAPARRRRRPPRSPHERPKASTLNTFPTAGERADRGPRNSAPSNRPPPPRALRNRLCRFVEPQASLAATLGHHTAVTPDRNSVTPVTHAARTPLEPLPTASRRACLPHHRPTDPSASRSGRNGSRLDLPSAPMLPAPAPASPKSRGGRARRPPPRAHSRSSHTSPIAPHRPVRASPARLSALV